MGEGLGTSLLRVQLSSEGQGYLAKLVNPDRDEWNQRFALLPIFYAFKSIAVFLYYLGTRYISQLRGGDVVGEEDSPDDGTQGTLRQLIKQNGGKTVFLFMLARVLGCIVLIGFSIPGVLESVTRKRGLGIFRIATEDFELPYALWLLANVYALVLASLAITYPSSRKRLIRDNIAILLFQLAVYLYRDVWPLATFRDQPKDLSEGWLLWGKLGALAFTAGIVPLFIPTVYQPFDPKTPSLEVNPEQTASIFSFFTFSYLSYLITASTKTDHLTVDQFPPIADYDKAVSLSSRALPHLDSVKIRKKGHIAFGIFRVLAPEYLSSLVAMIIYVSCKFLSPIAINQLLTVLESGGTQDTNVRPWFWILCLFLAPVGISLSWQSYMLTMSRTIVRAESILTQLIFDHSLRVRVKAESSESAPSKNSFETEGPTPEQDGGESHESRDATLVDDTSGNASRTSSEDGQPTKKKKDNAPPAPKEKSSKSFIGKLNNLATVDLSNVTGARDVVQFFFVIPTQIIGCSIILWFILGWSALVGLALMIVLLPVPGYMTKLMQGVQKERMKKTDNRTQTVTESMNVLRMIKMFGWEEKIQQRIANRREEELTSIWRVKLLGVLIAVVTFSIPTITMLVTFAMATLVMKMELTASKVFSSMILFDSMRNELQYSTYYVGAFIKGKVSIDRFNEFFKETDLLDAHEAADNADPSVATDLAPEASENEAIVLRNASFIWSPESAQDGVSTPSSIFRLSVSGELQFVRGKINMIVGPTGSGKTSLLMALLGEMHFTPSHPDSMFNLPRTGGVSFAVQESWVQNETIRDNILFHSSYDEERYKKVLYQCALGPDLELFEAGDLTEVGERGLTLSGGQKARLTLARAIYSKAQIILLDDILAALDVHTAKWIVNKCFKGDLVRDRTVLIVTHNIALVGPIADFIVSVSPDGAVTSRGSDLSAALLAEPALQADFKYDEEANAHEIEGELAEKPTEAEKQKAGKLIVAEEVKTGAVSWKPIKVFLKSLGGDRVSLFFALWIGGSAFEYITHSFTLWFMGYWSTQYENHPMEDIPVFRYMGIYAGLTLVIIAADMFKELWWVLGTMRSSRTIHKMLVESILGTTLRWLDETPISRIITRMTQDMNGVDGMLVNSAEALGAMSLVMVVDLISAVMFVPLFTLPGFFIAAVGMYIGGQYLKAQLSVKRELSNVKAPMLAHFGAAMAGLVSIRAYGVEATFREESKKRIDSYVRIARLNIDLNRWVTVRIDMLGAIFQASLAAYLTYVSNVSAANVGFSLNRAVEFCTMVLYLVRIFNMFQVEANSLERIVAYTEIEQEPKSTENGRPPAAWPTSGEIQVEDLSARYSKAGPTVLHGLTFNLHPGERVGVVGRTGSGKSSLTLALLRCIVTEGSVYYDGLATDKINLNDLRSNITIIPQMPELLSGTLRYNLDPFDEHDDATLNAALHSSGLYAAHSDAGEGRLVLDSNIAGGGANVSVGQRQIIALARAIIRSSKLLILDEATSAIDHETDGIIQNTLRRELGSDVTVLTIAHRLQTIIDADRVMVLDAGRIVEFASPAELLAKEKGAFKALVDESGDKEQLYEGALKQAKASGSRS